MKPDTSSFYSLNKPNTKPRKSLQLKKATNISYEISVKSDESIY